MLHAAALVPDTALLVPGASGATPVLAEADARSSAAVTRLVQSGPDRVVVVAPAPRATTDRRWVGDSIRSVRPDLAAAGVPDAVWRDAGVEPEPEAVRVQDTAAAVGLWLLGRTGWDGPLEVHVLAGRRADATDLHELGRSLVRAGRTALLLLGSLSARRGPDAPLPDDDRAAAVDGAVLADLVHLDPAARARLAAVPADLAQDLAISAWAPWQILLGALGPDDEEPGADLRALLHRESVPLGATYAVVSWDVRPADAPAGAGPG